jgi:murein DD-endopeptidase MepM/ murein hydrolase activator NlpD
MTSFDVEMQFPVDPDGFTKVYGGPNQGGHQGSDWYIQYGMDLGGSAGTNVYAAFDGHVTKFHPHNPASDAGGVYGAQIFMRYPNDEMGGFYTHITDVSASIHGESSPGAGDGSQVERGDFLGTVISFGGIPPHLHLALVEIIGGAPNGQYVGVNLYQFFIDLETTYAGECVPVTFMQDGTPPTTN